MLQLLFENDSNYIPANDLLKMLESVMLKSLELEGFTKEVEISLTFTTDELAMEYAYWGAMALSMVEPSLGERIASSAGSCQSIPRSGSFQAIAPSDWGA